MKAYDSRNLHEVTLVKAKNSANTLQEPHTHSYFELVYVLDGGCLHILNGREMLIGKGDYFLIDRGSWHAYQTDKALQMPIINILFSPRLFDLGFSPDADFETVMQCETIRFHPDQIHGSPAGHIFHDLDGQVRSWFVHADEEYSRHRAGWRELMRADVTSILVSMLRQRYYLKDPIARRDFVRYLKKYVKENYAAEINLSELCREINYSLPYVSKCFRAETGRTFSEYLQEVRITKSCTLLRNTEMSVESICEAVGYHNTTFFHRIFKETLGMTPLAFRAEMRRQGQF